jgi:hypothetical protein
MGSYDVITWPELSGNFSHHALGSDYSEYFEGGVFIFGNTYA